MKGTTQQATCQGGQMACCQNGGKGEIGFRLLRGVDQRLASARHPWQRCASAASIYHNPTFSILVLPCSWPGLDRGQPSLRCHPIFWWATHKKHSARLEPLQLAVGVCPMYGCNAHGFVPVWFLCPVSPTLYGFPFRHGGLSHVIISKDFRSYITDRIGPPPITIVYRCIRKVKGVVGSAYWARLSAQGQRRQISMWDFSHQLNVGVLGQHQRIVCNSLGYVC